MKIKNLFTTIEFTTTELEDLFFKLPIPIGVGISRWIKYKFGLDLFPKLKKYDNNTKN